MKSFLRLTIINTICLFSVSAFFPGLVVSHSLRNLLWAGAIFTLINYLVKPIIKLFLLPINLLTLGLFRWLANVIVLLILTKIVNHVQITSFITPIINQAGFSAPSFPVNYALSLIISSFLLSFVFNILNWLLSSTD